MKNTVAVLLACHNRKGKTMACLEHLFKATLPKGHKLEVFLVDDGSTDGTGEAVKERFPQVNLIQGNGQLYWNQGMRLAWQTAAKTKDYDFYLWLNDDVILNKNALIDMLQCFNETFNKDSNEAIIVGACRTHQNEDIFTYGGRTEKGPLIPNGKLQKCIYINGNAVLISNKIFKTLGNLSEDYTHAMGDFDYGLRAIKAGLSCYTTKSYIAVCEINEGIPAWCNPKIPLSKRLKILYSPKGLNIKEYNHFRKKFWKYKWIIFSAKAYIKCVFPSFHQKTSNLIIR